MQNDNTPMPGVDRRDGVEDNTSNSIIEEIVMSKAYHVFLLCSALAVPFLGSSNAHAFVLLNRGFDACLDVRFGNTANRTPVQAFRCNATFEQQWTWVLLEIRGIGTTAAGGKCVDVDGGGTADGTVVQLFQCNGTVAQQWVFSNGQIINPHSGKCLDVGDEFATRATIRICNGGLRQTWALRS